MDDGSMLPGDVALKVAAVPHEDGRFISDEVSRIVEIIREYDAGIDVEWIPPDTRAPRDPEFRIIEVKPDGRRFVMFYVNNQLEFNENVLARIFQSDQAKNKFSLEAIDAHNNAVKAIELKKQWEELQEKHDIAAHIWKSGRARYRHDGVVHE